MLIFPKSWWQLPFAGALLYYAKVINRCQLCGINPCQADIATKANAHWFNHLTFLCQDCHQHFVWQGSQFVIELSKNQQLTGIASYFYQYPFNQTITKFKNQHDLRQIILLVHALRQLDKPLNCESHDSVILIVPTTTKRLINRGFDPLYFLSLYLSFHWQIPLFTAIQREDRAHQQGLSRDERLTNVQNAFTFTALPDVKNLILFDDVVTTGATLQSVISSLAHQNKQQKYPMQYRLFARAILHGNP